jgi:single-stranded-DNA-specific exonuclease
VDLAAAFAACAPLMVRHGGHAEAAGCDMLPANFDEFRRRFLEIAEASPITAEEALRVDLAVPATEVDYSLYRELGMLDPVGPGNPAPQLAVLDATVTRVRQVANGHVQLTVSKGREVLDVIAFGRGDLADSAAAGARVDIVARISSRTFGGYESLQLELLDIAPARRKAAPPVAQ